MVYAGTRAIKKLKGKNTDMIAYLEHLFNNLLGEFLKEPSPKWIRQVAILGSRKAMHDAGSVHSGEMRHEMQQERRSFRPVRHGDQIPIVK